MGESEESQNRRRTRGGQGLSRVIGIRIGLSMSFGTAGEASLAAEDAEGSAFSRAKRGLGEGESGEVKSRGNTVTATTWIR